MLGKKKNEKKRGRKTGSKKETEPNKQNNCPVRQKNMNRFFRSFTPLWVVLNNSITTNSSSIIVALDLL